MRIISHEDTYIMGWNTTVVVLNDALDQIEKDPQFGASLARAIRHMPVARHRGEDRIDVAAGNHCNAACVIESHHADSTALVSVGGNLGLEQLVVHGWNHHEQAGQERLLRAWAEKLGFEVTPKPAAGVR